MKQVKCKFPVRILTLLLGLFLSVSAFAQSTITGQVKDATGEPVIGASVLINGTSNGTVTDLDGNFSISVQPGATLTISYIGFQKQQVAAANGMVITLQEDQAQQMNEVVVIGYGAVKKSDLTGSVTALKPDSKNKGLVVNAQDMLAGKVAGVSVTSDGGTPGGGANIRIRGGSSLNASNNPLIVIDGVAMDQTGIKGVSNPLSLVNPQDIESFNVLKDASATAIYVVVQMVLSSLQLRRDVVVCRCLIMVALPLVRIQRTLMSCLLMSIVALLQTSLVLIFIPSMLMVIKFQQLTHALVRLILTGRTKSSALLLATTIT